jgi:hypothetical protein
MPLFIVPAIADACIRAEKEKPASSAAWVPML